VNYKTSVLLLSLLGVLFLAHAWASRVNTQTTMRGRNYCIFCFPVTCPSFLLRFLLVACQRQFLAMADARLRQVVGLFWSWCWQPVWFQRLIPATCGWTGAPPFAH
jgi:hypothetical protein